MKKLILPLIFLPMMAFAVSEMNSISDKEIESKFLTVVKDVEVEKMLGGTSQFNDCRKKNEIESTDTQAVKDDKIDKATTCFKSNITGKNTAALKKLADDLKLESYGLIKSKNVNDITDYLAKKMRKSLTGVDADAAVTQKWEDKKIVDQKVFIDLYTNQLMKNALFEVSRFCFQNLRVTLNNTKLNFADHWNNSMKYIEDVNGNPVLDASGKPTPDITLLDDEGQPEFFKMSPNVDPTKKEEVYKDLISGLSKGGALKPQLYADFFNFCQAALPKLCQDFRKTLEKSNINDPDKAVVVANKMTKGANACLAMDKLQGIRTTMKNTKKVADQFEEMGNDKSSFAIQMIKNPQFYQRGKGMNEDSLDMITSVSSADMLANANNDLQKLEKKCLQGSGGSQCDDFLIKNDSLDKAINNVESQMNLKREIELARVRDLKKTNDATKLEEYLTENGLFDLLEKVKNPPAGFDIEKAIGSIYDARKIAEIESLKLKVGKRQVNESEMQKLVSSKEKDNQIIKNITETKEERARLAQVVMFNNIITSQLKLTDRDTKKEVGRNTNAWKKEMQGLKDSDSYNDKLFDGIMGDPSDSPDLDDTSIVGGGIIDSILGKKDDP